MLHRFVLPLALLAATPVFAQPVPSPDATTAPATREGRMRERLQQAHDRLGITPTQQPQWDAVVAALRDNARAMRANPARQAERAGSLNAVEELHAAADVAHARADALQRMIPSVEALYATLSPEQQRMADQALARAMHGGKRRG